ncbi:transposase [Azospirillum formosense]|uniref:transposase n=1 Tax=Azospirillum formosense TaxID=861533 RepID=UPI001C900AF1|nr:hypothetical protein [Azospirillum formosense]
MVVMDNHSAHKRADIPAAFETAGIRVRSLPRYSPDLSPIEPGWAKLKGILRAKEEAINEVGVTFTSSVTDSRCRPEPVSPHPPPKFPAQHRRRIHRHIWGVPE